MKLFLRLFPRPTVDVTSLCFESLSPRNFKRSVNDLVSLNERLRLNQITPNALSFTPCSVRLEKRAASFSASIVVFFA